MSASKIVDIRAHQHASSGSGTLIDLHSHILPGIDDGARDLDEAIQMLKMAATDGIRIMTATPHASRIMRDVYEASIVELRMAAREAGIDLAILSGSEVRLTADLGDRFRAGELISINNTRYVLVELPFERDWSPAIHSALYALQLAGASPVIAHAERYPAIQRQPGLLLELVKMGALIQVNAGSLLGDDGRTSRRTAEGIVRAGLAHVIATDAHRIDRRRPLLRGALERIASLTSQAEATRTQLHAAAIIQDRAITIPEPRADALHPGSRFGLSLLRL